MFNGPRRVATASYECSYLGTLAAMIAGEAVAIGVNSVLGTSIDRNVTYPVIAVGVYSLFEGAKKVRNRNQAAPVIPAVAPAIPPAANRHMPRDAGPERVDHGDAGAGVEAEQRGGRVLRRGRGNQ